MICGTAFWGRGVIGMKIRLKSPGEIRKMRDAGQIVAACQREIAGWVVPGITTLEIDSKAEALIRELGGTPAQKGYKGYPYATCASVNEVVCHGLPDSRPLEDGDVVTIDLVVNKDGWMADSGWTYAAGTPPVEVAKLMECTRKALRKGIEQARAGRCLGDIGYAVETCAAETGCGIVRSLVGHGIGQSIHEPPDVLPFGIPGKGKKLREGMVITIEPVFTLGMSGAVWWGDDGWSIYTADGRPGVQYEHTVAITADGPLILTE